MSVRQRFDELSHSRQASQLREQMRGLLPDSVQPAAAAVASEAGAGTEKLLDYVRLAAEYWEPAVALLQRFRRRAPEMMAEAGPAAQRRFGARPFVAVGITVGVGLAAYGAFKIYQDFKRNA